MRPNKGKIPHAISSHFEPLLIMQNAIVHTPGIEECITLFFGKTTAPQLLNPRDTNPHYHNNYGQRILKKTSDSDV